MPQSVSGCASLHDAIDDAISYYWYYISGFCVGGKGKNVGLSGRFSIFDRPRRCV